MAKLAMTAVETNRCFVCLRSFAAEAELDAHIVQCAKEQGLKKRKLLLEQKQQHKSPSQQPVHPISECGKKLPVAPSETTEIGKLPPENSPRPSCLVTRRRYVQPSGEAAAWSAATMEELEALLNQNKEQMTRSHSSTVHLKAPMGAGVGASAADAFRLRRSHSQTLRTSSEQPEEDHKASAGGGVLCCVSESGEVVVSPAHQQHIVEGKAAPDGAHPLHGSVVEDEASRKAGEKEEATPRCEPQPEAGSPPPLAVQPPPVDTAAAPTEVGSPSPKRCVTFSSRPCVVELPQCESPPSHSTSPDVVPPLGARMQTTPASPPRRAALGKHIDATPTTQRVNTPRGTRLPATSSCATKTTTERKGAKTPQPESHRVAAGGRPTTPGHTIAASPKSAPLKQVHSGPVLPAPTPRGPASTCAVLRSATSLLFTRTASYAGHLHVQPSIALGSKKLPTATSAVQQLHRPAVQPHKVCATKLTTRVPPPAPFVVHPSAPSFCAQCGKKYVDGALFCAYCGHKREHATLASHS